MEDPIVWYRGEIACVVGLIDDCESITIDDKGTFCARRPIYFSVGFLTCGTKMCFYLE